MAQRWNGPGKYDGTSPTATVVAVNRFNDSLFYVASAGNALYFVASDEAHGDELWRFTLTP